jgi:hypothetical protein
MSDEDTLAGLLELNPSRPAVGGAAKVDEEVDADRVNATPLDSPPQEGEGLEGE